MSRDWVNDINEMHKRFGVHEWVETTIQNGDVEKLRKFLEFRVSFLREELEETEKALATNDAEEIVDGLIDLCVVAIGTLDAFGVDAYEAWDAVHRANMAKERGVKASRPNPLNMPDLIKPSDWQPPSHYGNHGLMKKL